MFANGIHPTHAVLIGKTNEGHRPTLTGPQQRQIIRAVRERYVGGINHGEPLILDGLIEDVKRLEQHVERNGFSKQQQQHEERITQGFGVNPIIMGQVEGANRAIALAAETHFADWCVNPKIALMSQCLTRMAVPAVQEAI